MTIKDLKENDLILYECISGSKAYGLDLPESDTDIKGVFILPQEMLYGFNYIPQVSDENNDQVYYELGRFLELLSKNNPNILELLATPEDKILKKHPIIDRIKPEDFLSKKCKDTFGGYAFTQVKKARGLNKKIVNPIDKEKKNLLEFCYVLSQHGSMPLLKWLDQHGYQQENCGLVKINHVKDIYALFYDAEGINGFKGILKKNHATQVLLSSVPKGLDLNTYLYFNEDGFSKYCKDYKEYWDWVEERNDARYENNVKHGKNYDSKNMMHTFRLLDMAIEILEEGKVYVKRPNRAELLSIRKGDWDYDELIEKANQKMKAVEQAFKQSQLQDQPKVEDIEKLLVELRNQIYAEKN